jgi:pimeloyl-ACP methyl ester carboxylesterase
MARFEAITGKYVHIEVQGVEYRVYFEESGQGIPLLCQHTAGGEGVQWRHLMNDQEVTSRVRVIAADLPYHGKSLPPESVEWWKQEYRLTKSFFIDFLIELSHVLGLEEPVFLGSSMGGHLALDLALECPDEFRAVIGL